MKTNKTLENLIKLIISLMLLSSCTADLTKPKVQSVLTNEGTVLTPFGQMPKSMVHTIENGYSVKEIDNHLMKVETSTGKAVENFGEVMSSKNLSTAAKIDGNDPGSNNQIVWAQTGNYYNLNVTYLSTTWIVPLAPTTINGETLFIFCSIGNGSDTFYQPVLQYGVSAAGGGEYWSIANWYYNGTQIVSSSLITNISPGTSLQGVLSLTNGSWTSSFTGYSNSLTASNGNFVGISYERLSGYPMSAGYYPDQYGVAMIGIQIKSGSTYLPNGFSGGWLGTHGEFFTAPINSSANGEIDIFFRSAGTPSGLYIANGGYPITLTWNGTYGALSYDISYSVQDHSGHYTYYNGTSTSTSYTFPFTNTTCKGCELVPKVRAHYTGGVVSNWSAPTSTTMQ